MVNEPDILINLTPGDNPQRGKKAWKFFFSRRKEIPRNERRHLSSIFYTNDLRSKELVNNLISLVVSGNIVTSALCVTSLFEVL